jgi:hypothetical protein
MQSFKVLLHHRAACVRGGVLAGLFWTDPSEIARSFPIAALMRIAATGTLGGWAIRRLLPAAQTIAGLSSSYINFMLRWARELIVDRTVLVYSPPLHERVGPRLGPVHLFADQHAMWQAASTVLGRQLSSAGRLRIRVFPQGGLTYVTGSE